MARIFFSYSQSDIDKVTKVKEAIEAKGHEVWLDKQNIKVGFSIPQAVNIGLGNCDFLAVFLTKNAEKSHWIKKEIATFFMRDMQDKTDRILPLKFEDCRISDFVGILDTKYADFTLESKFDQSIQEILRRIDSTPELGGHFSRPDYERLLFAIDVAIRAGTTTMLYYNSSLRENVTLDERKNSATEADRTAQIRSTTQIQTDPRYSHERIITEEEPFCHSSVDENGYTWVIDSLDGTNNFVNRIPIFCSAIGILKQGKPFIGIIYDPAANEIYYAMTGQPTQLWRISSGESNYITSDINMTIPNQAILATHISSRPEIAQKLFQDDLLLKFSQKFNHIRILGCGQLALAWVASGRLHAFVQVDTYLWDQVAGIVLLQNSGGVVKDIGECAIQSWTFKTRSLAACCNEKILNAVLEELVDFKASADHNPIS